MLEHSEGEDPDRGPDRGRDEDAAWSRRAAERLLDQRTSGRQGPGAHEEYREDEHEGHELGHPRRGQPTVLALEVGDLRLDHPDGETADDGRHDVLEPAEKRSRERGNDEQGVGERGK